jgi:hypothetical protein
LIGSQGRQRRNSDFRKEREDMVRTLKYYFVMFNRHGLNCGHEHHSVNAVKRCFWHYKKYYPDLQIMKRIEINEVENLLAEDIRW